MSLPFSLDHLPVELAQTVAQAWQRFDEACAAHGDASLLATAATRDELPRVWAGSDFVSGVCIRAPQLLADLIGGGELDRRGGGAELLGRIDSELADCRDQDDLDARLRTIRRTTRNQSGIHPRRRGRSGYCRVKPDASFNRGKHG